MRQRIYDAFFLAVLLLALYGLCRVLAPFVGALMAALVCAIAFDPLYRKIQTLWPTGRSSWHAALCDAIVMIFVVGPLVAVVWAMANESDSLLPRAQEAGEAIAQWRQRSWMDSLPALGPLKLFLYKAFGVSSTKLQVRLLDWIQQAMQSLSAAGVLLARHFIGAVIDLLMMLFALFFMFRDGRKGVRFLQEWLPMRRDKSAHLIERIHRLINGLWRGLFLTSLVQGALAAVGYAIAGVHGALLLGALTAISGMIPLIGTFGIWLPLGLVLLAHGEAGAGAFVLLWGLFVVVGFVDVLLRPRLVGKQAQLSTFAMFFAFLGGIEVWGAKGMILGPFIAGIVPDLLVMYKERFSRQEESESVDSACNLSKTLNV